MFKMMDGVNALYQWDLNRKLVVEDDSINEVHFCHKKDENALVCEVYEADGVRLVNVPNILLQSGSNICAYAYRIDHTVFEKVFNVHRRVKPEDYVYTETEVKSYEALDARIKVLEDKPAEIDAEDVVRIVKDNFAGGVGYEETSEVVMLPETSFEVSGEGTTLSESFPYTFEIGKDYTVTLDGVTNTYTAVEYASGIGIITNTSIEEVMKGNGWLLGNVVNLEIMTQDTSFYGTHTISFSGEVTNTYKIAEKYTGISAKMDKTNPVGEGSFSLNRKADSTIGSSSFAEGYNTTASGDDSHAEGRGTTASGIKSHAEGYNTTASGDDSHAEGSDTTASGMYSHSEGSHTTASSYMSHAEGYGTVAASRNQHAQGRWNVEDSNGVYAHIIGGGTDNTHRKNIHTVDWSGNAWYAGNVEGKAIKLPSSTSNSTKKFIITVNDNGELIVTDAGDSTVTNTIATKSYVDEIIGGIENGTY